MKRFDSKFSTIVSRFIYSLYAFFTFIILLFTLISPQTESLTLRMLLIALGGIFIVVLFLRFWGYKIYLWLENANPVGLAAILFLLCLAVKLTFVLLYPIEPAGDYLTFYNSAVTLSRGEILNSRYVALFPHILGYSSFLSIFFKLFGTGYAVAPVVNTVVSAACIPFFFYIGHSFISKFGACVACLIWIFFPSQTVYNIFVLSEPLYCLELLIAFSIMIFIARRIADFSFVKCIAFSLLLALFLQFVNMARPIAFIPIIAFFIWFFFVETSHFRNRKLLFRKLSVFAVTLVAFFSFSLIGNWYAESKIGEAPATVPGYNIYVGFNTDSMGQWNQSDSDLLFHYSDLPGWSAQQVQQQMLKEAENRILHDDINFADLFFHKFLALWQNDDFCIRYYASDLFGGRNLRALCNGFYFATLLFSLIGAISAIIRKEKNGGFFLLCIFMIGLTLAHMLVEVAPRYHYSGLLTFTLMAAYGICELNRLFHRSYRKDNTRKTYLYNLKQFA